MMPGPHMPPAFDRRQTPSGYYIPPAHSPVTVPHTYPQQYYQAPYFHQPYSHPLPPRPIHSPFQQQHSPVVVSSHPVHRQHVRTPPVAPIHTPSVAPQTMPAQASLPAASTSSVNSQPLASPAMSATAMSTSTPPPVASSRPSTSAPAVPASGVRMPYYPELPWYSHPDEPFPPKARRQRRRRHTPIPLSQEPLELPARRDAGEIAEVEEGDGHMEESRGSTLAAASDQETPATSQAPSEGDSTHPTTPSSAVPPASTPRAQAPSAHTRKATVPAVPLVPIKPASPATAQRKGSAATSTAEKPAGQTPQTASEKTAPASSASPESEQTAAPTSPPPKAAPKSWADLVRAKGASKSNPASTAPVNGSAPVNGFASGKSDSVADFLQSYRANSGDKVSFLEPRGLVNTGNMCYMNSVLQTLVFCLPFYDFLDEVRKRSAYKFKSETPLLDAMIMFMREYKVIDSATSEEQLRYRLKSEELEQYGDAFIPEFVYECIKSLPRFSGMRRGHQQDAEEFLGFLLAGLHDECVNVMKNAAPTTQNEPQSPEMAQSSTADGWLEVGPKQKASITRSSGMVDSDTPVTKLFGGKLRSVLRVPGLKDSVTLEPYQPLQLDIGAPDVNNITDALKGLTRPETLQGDFNSPRGPGISAVKQVFIETLPPVLILHLKRFQYDNTGGTQKIWKKVGYPLELEVPKEVFPPHARAGLPVKGGPPKYRLVGVVYHHGKNASGGHYTVDVRRQDGKEWIRMDDTVLRRVRAEDVAEGGSEEDPKLLAKALEQHKRDQNVSKNIYEQAGLDEDEVEQPEGGWSQVNGSSATGPSGKKWTGVVNGTTTPSSAGKRTPMPDKGAKDSKVAYILFYEQIRP
ncbi:cysteine proteinase [Saccharata proteae CBS 121410]|uniref:Ubiquitin carboxyl-terminal hydrolase n=1 Tax=Saccharata proteae CBS 121410 TaxID=1314787 RepID=A0A9P4I1G1_9PEZI|nr:cysteine proteinase [Saccharata proteae CBS 121410]